MSARFDALLVRFTAAGHEAPRRAAAELEDQPDAVVERVLAGVPLFRALGAREFHGLKLALSPETLEPRDDTEALVDAVLAARPPHDARFADLGTGTGAVALALLSELPDASAVVTDISPVALETAVANASANGLQTCFEARQGSWLEPLDGVFDFIVSNPPYIASSIVGGLDPSVLDHDPRRALDGGADGLDAYRAILSGAAAHLKPGGFLALEIGYDQRASVKALAESHLWHSITCTADLAGRDRALLLHPPVATGVRDSVK